MVTLMLWLYRKVLQCVVTVLSVVTKTVSLLLTLVVVWCIIVFTLTVVFLAKFGTESFHLLVCKEKEND